MGTGKGKKQNINRRLKSIESEVVMAVDATAECAVVSAQFVPAKRWFRRDEVQAVRNQISLVCRERDGRKVCEKGVCDGGVERSKGHHRGNHEHDVPNAPGPWACVKLAHACWGRLDSGGV